MNRGASSEELILALLLSLLLLPDDSLLVMELGTPRGNDTTIGSYSGSLGVTSTWMEVVRIFFLGDGCCLLGEDEVTLSVDLRFFDVVAIFQPSKGR